MAIEITSVREPLLARKLKLKCPICEKTQEVVYGELEYKPYMCTDCFFLFPDLFLLAKTAPPSIGFNANLSGLNNKQRENCTQAYKKREQEILSFHCEGFDFG